MSKVSAADTMAELEHITRAPLAAALALIGGRWKLLLLYHIARGTNRHAGLRASLPGLREKMLYQQLRELQRDGVLARTMVGGVAVYRETLLGASLLPHVSALETWSVEHQVGARLMRARSV